VVKEEKEEEKKRRERKRKRFEYSREPKLNPPFCPNCGGSLSYLNGKVKCDISGATFSFSGGELKERERRREEEPTIQESLGSVSPFLSSDRVKLDKRIRKVLEDLGYNSPTEVQSEAIPLLINDKTLLLAAPTGSGKTLAALIPAFQKIIRDESFQTLYIAPRTALIRNLKKRLKKWERKLGLTVYLWYGKKKNNRSQRRKFKRNRKGTDLLITTLEGLQLILRKSLISKHEFEPDYLIIDEIHDLVGTERGAQLSLTMERLPEASKVQRVGLSATAGNLEDVASLLAGTGRKYGIVKVERESPPKINIASPKGAVPLGFREEIMMDKVCDEVEREIRNLVFTNTRQRTEEIANYLGNNLSEEIKEKSMDLAHHASLSKKEKTKIEDRFMKGEVQTLVATSSMELGVDLKVNQVIQFLSPKRAVNLAQRIGRHRHKPGQATPEGTIIVGHPDAILEVAAITSRVKNGSFRRLPTRRSLAALVPALVHMAVNNRGYEEIFKLVKHAYPYRDLTKGNFNDFVQELGFLRKEHEGLSVKEKFKYKFKRPWHYTMIIDKMEKGVYSERGEKIGTIDSRYANSLREGDVFLLGGKNWLVYDLETKKDNKRDREYVEKVKVKETPRDGEAPFWTGEKLGVRCEVAQKVGEIKRMVEEELRKEGNLSAAIKNLSEKTILSGDLLENVTRFIKIQMDNSFPVPTDRRITIEKEKSKRQVINIHLGDRCNQTLAHILGSYGKNRIQVREVTPYKIELTTNMSNKKIKKILEELTLEGEENLKEYIITSLKENGQLKAEKEPLGRYFGGNNELKEKEALERIFHYKLNLDQTLSFLKKIRRGEVDLK